MKSPLPRVAKRRCRVFGAGPRPPAPTGRGHAYRGAIARQRRPARGRRAWAPGGADGICSGVQGGRSSQWRAADAGLAVARVAARRRQRLSQAARRTNSILHARVRSSTQQYFRARAPLVWVTMACGGERGASRSRPHDTWIMAATSPDGTRIAVTIVSGDDDIWVYDIARNTSRRLTLGGINLWPKWTPDGTRIAYTNPRSSRANFYVRRADGAGAEQQLTPPSPETTTPRPRVVGVPGSWSPDGTVLAFAGSTLGGIWMWSAQEGGRLTPFFQATGTEGEPTFLLSGHAVAYVTNESGRREPYGHTLGRASPFKYQRAAATSRCGRETAASCFSGVATQCCRSRWRPTARRRWACPVSFSRESTRLAP